MFWSGGVPWSRLQSLEARGLWVCFVFSWEGGATGASLAQTFFTLLCSSTACLVCVFAQTHYFEMLPPSTTFRLHICNDISLSMWCKQTVFCVGQCVMGDGDTHIVLGRTLTAAASCDRERFMFHALDSHFAHNSNIHLFVCLFMSSLKSWTLGGNLCDLARAEV